MVQTAFGERLAYARWLRVLTEGGEDSDAAVIAGAGVKGPWLSKWKKRHDAPDRRKEIKALVAYLGCDEDWLTDGKGDPPRKDLWPEWYAKNRWPPQKKKHPAPPRHLVATQAQKAKRGRSGGAKE